MIWVEVAFDVTSSNNPAALELDRAILNFNFYDIVVSQDDTISDRDDDFNIIFNFYDISVSKLCPSPALLCKQGLTKSIIHSSLKKETDKTDCLVLRLFKNHTFQHSRAQRID